MMFKASKLGSALIGILLIAGPALAAKPPVLKLRTIGKTSMAPGVPWRASAGKEGFKSIDSEREGKHDQLLKATIAQRLAKMGTAALISAPVLAVPSANPLRIRDAGHGVSGFNGISNFEQANAGPGNGTVEPPDQAMCVGNGFVFEAVNDALAVYDKKGNEVAGPLELALFFAGIPASNPSANTFSDPRCMHDAATDRWFVTVVEYNFDAFGSLAFSAVDIAVSASGDPTGSYLVYQLNTQNDADFAPAFDCPCLSDQPLLGADANGLYISTNSYGTFGFEGAQLYAISKKDLVAFSPAPHARHFEPLSLPPFFALTDPELAFTVQPAITPPGASSEANTAYFMQALIAQQYESQIGVWAVSNTSAIDTDPTQMSLNLSRIDSQVYAAPVGAIQRAGPTPLATSLDMTMQNVAANDQRMQQAVYVGGKLYGALTTAVTSPGQMNRSGVAYFVAQVSNPPTGLKASVVQQGYVAGDENASTLFPAVAVNKHGKGAIVFTLVGPSQFPSSAYWKFGGHAIHVAGEGSAPEDGFSAYLFARPRWGDYSAASADADGSLWMATEFIPNTVRGHYANWGTFITSVRTGDGENEDEDEGDDNGN